MLPIVITLLCFTFTLLLVLGLYRSSTKFSVEKRIERMADAEARTTEEELEKPFFQRILLPLGDAASRVLRRWTPAEFSTQTQKKLIMAGLFPRVTPGQILGLCWLCMVLATGLMFSMLVVMGTGPGGTVKIEDPLNAICLVAAILGGFTFPQFELGRKVRHRQEEILISLPYAIDLLSISVEAGMGFDAALGYTMRKTKGPLAEEFGKTLNEIRLGKPRLEALEDLGRRAGVEDLKAFITAVVHASKLGGSITNTLRIQADSIRVRRRQRAQERAMKAPVKMVFPLVLFIFPALFVVILGPAVLSVIGSGILK